MSVAANARKTLRLLDNGNNWIKGASHTIDGKHCLLGAVTASTTMLKDRFALVEAIEDEIDQPDGFGIIGWNDHSRRTWPEVEEALNRVIKTHSTWNFRRLKYAFRRNSVYSQS